MKQGPDVSVVMSVYNGEATLAATMDSVLSQEGVDLEFIVTDDGSSDASGAILRDYARRDHRIRAIYQQNSGLTIALIRGCAEARGQYIARQDADDLSHPRRLSLQLELMRADKRIGFVSCSTHYVGPADEYLEIVTRPSDPELATQGLLHERQGPPAHGSVMFSRAIYEKVGGYRREFYYAQDSDLWLRMGECSLVGYVEDVLYFARRNPESISGARNRIQHRFGEIGHQCRHARLRGQSEQPYLDEARRFGHDLRTGHLAGRNRDWGSMLDATYALGSRLALNGDGRARHYLWPVVQSRPWHWKAWFRLIQSYL